MTKAPTLPGSDPELELEACCDEFAGTAVGLRDGQFVKCPKCGQRLQVTVVDGLVLPRKVVAS